MADAITSICSNSNASLFNDFQEAEHHHGAIQQPTLKINRDVVVSSKNEKSSTSVSKAVSVESKSLWRRAVDCFYQLCGFTPNKTNDTVDSSIDLDMVKETIADTDENNEVMKSISALNKELIQQMQDQKELERELQNHFDRVILTETIARIQFQRDLKDVFAREHYQDIMYYQEENRELQKKFYSLKEEIQGHEKNCTALKIASACVTVATIGVFAASFAVGVGVMALAMPMSGLSKTGLILLQGSIKHIKRGKEGEMFIVKHERERNSEFIANRLQEGKSYSSESSQLISTMKSHINNNSSTIKAIYH